MREQKRRREGETKRGREGEKKRRERRRERRERREEEKRKKRRVRGVARRDATTRAHGVRVVRGESVVWLVMREKKRRREEEKEEKKKRRRRRRERERERERREVFFLRRFYSVSPLNFNLDFPSHSAAVKTSEHKVPCHPDSYSRNLANGKRSKGSTTNKCKLQLSL